jgi:hypothetical protein
MHGLWRWNGSDIKRTTDYGHLLLLVRQRNSCSGSLPSEQFDGSMKGAAVSQD